MSITLIVDTMIQMDDLLKTMQLENAKAGFWSQDQDMAHSVVLTIILQHLLDGNKETKMKN